MKHYASPIVHLNALKRLYAGNSLPSGNAENETILHPDHLIEKRDSKVDLIKTRILYSKNAFRLKTHGILFGHGSIDQNV